MNQRSTNLWFLWPFAALWRLLALVLIITGRILGIILALGLMILGIALIVTVAGMPIGIPFAILGLLLMIRSIF
jgi:hypothetical protein